jgi:ABC-2 type transport system permease protein/lipopolysaccharide transport system permease protein
LTGVQLTRGLEDLRAGFADWRLWGYLGWHDIRQRYRRSKLGPFWVTASMALHVGAIGLVWSSLFGMSARDFVPYLCAGTVVWNLILGNVTEGCGTFITASHFISQINRPISVYAFWVVWRNLLIFVHTLAVYVVVVLIFGLWPNVNTFQVLIGFPVLLLAVSWPPLLLGLVTARFRDIQQLVQSLMTMVFFVTPIIWRLDQLHNRAYLATLNPLTHLIEIVRAPLLGQPIPLSSLAAALVTVALGWLLTVAVFSRYRARIAYWL